MAADRKAPAARTIQFMARVLQDAMAEASAAYWERRARTFEEAAPRPGDYTGHASTADLEAGTARCQLAAKVCRQRASIERHGQPIDPDAWLVLAERIAS